jgi:ATP-dependent Clp protease ATP-binding subunit ClpC
MAAMFERMTDRARKTIVLSQEEARLLNHAHIGTEHLLLGLISEGEGVAASALASFDISLDKARRQVEQYVRAGPSASPGHIPFTPRSKKLLELSLREALKLGHSYIGTEHLLLALLREGEGVGAQVIVELGAPLESVRAEVLGLLEGHVEQRDNGLPGSEPLCSGCRASVEYNVRWREVQAMGPDDKTHRAVLIVYCGACGTTLNAIG